MTFTLQNPNYSCHTTPHHIVAKNKVSIDIVKQKEKKQSVKIDQSINKKKMGRSPCCEKAHTNKGAWTKEEDDRLIAYIGAHGEGCWRSLPKAAGLLRCGKSCRLRWINYLRPDLKRGNFTHDEDELIIKLHSLLGNKYVLFCFPLFYFYVVTIVTSLVINLNYVFVGGL